jgi:hypothetical protein
MGRISWKLWKISDDNKLGSKQKVVFGLNTKEINQDYYVNIRPMLSFM